MVACACSPSYSRGWGRRIAWTRDCTIVLHSLQPEPHGKTLSQKQKKIAKWICCCLGSGMVAHSNPRKWSVWGGQIMRSRIWDHSGQYGETLSLLKTRKLAGCGGRPCSPSYSEGWGRRITWTCEVEVAVSCDCATALQPGWQSKILSQKIKK